MVKILLELDKEEDEKVKYFKHIFELKTKKDAIKKIIKLTKITPIDKERAKDEIMEAFK